MPLINLIDRTWNKILLASSCGLLLPAVNKTTLNNRVRSAYSIDLRIWPQCSGCHQMSKTQVPKIFNIKAR